MTTPTDRLMTVREFMRGFFADDSRAAPVLLDLDLAIAATMTVIVYDKQNTQSPARPLAVCFDESDHDGIAAALNDLTSGPRAHVGGGGAAEFVIERKEARS